VNLERKRPAGRARSDASRTAILLATLKLLESSTLQQVSVEAIAREAGVGKATIYRWWTSKASVVIDAFIQYHVAHTPMPRGMPPREALSRHLHLLIDEYSGRSGQLVAQILAQGQADPEVLREFRERFFYGRQAVVREVMEQGRRSGEFRTDLDTVEAMDLLYSPIYFRLVIGHLPLDRRFADSHAQSILSLLSGEGACAGPASPPKAVARTNPSRKTKRVV
jgi:AcrR family transcriptional regulator